MLMTMRVSFLICVFSIAAACTNWPVACRAPMASKMPRKKRMLGTFHSFKGVGHAYFFTLFFVALAVHYFGDDPQNAQPD